MNLNRLKLAVFCVAALALNAGTIARADKGTPTETATTETAPEKAEMLTPVLVEEPAPEKEWSVSAGFDVWSEYIFRGVDLSGNDAMLNPYASASCKGFTAYYWGAYSDSDPGRWYEEADLGAEYSHSFLEDKLTLTGGYLYYWYPDGTSGADTSELYGKAAVDVLLSPYVSLFYDIDEFHGGYLSFGIGHSFDIGKMLGMDEGKLSIDPSAQLSIDLGYNSRSSQSNIQFNDLLLGIKVPWQLTENVQVHVGYQASIAMDALNNIGQGNESIGNIGITLTY